MEIKKVSLADIKPYFNNPRDNAKAVPPTMESIKRFGFISPIITDKFGVIIIGHTRYIAAFQLGMKEVPVIYSDMDEGTAKLCRIADNKLAEKSSYNEQSLIDELRNMKVPSDMQSFFFEDISEMLNFDGANLINQSPSVDANFDLSHDDSLMSVDLYSSDDSDDSDYGNDYKGSVGSDEVVTSPHSETHVPETSRELYKPFVEDGVTKIKVVCPYCGNIETIEYKKP